MSNQAEYRIEYAIQRRLPGDEDFTEIGFGSSGAHSGLDAAVYAIESDVGNGHWEIAPGMRGQAGVMADIARDQEDL